MKDELKQALIAIYRYCFGMGSPRQDEFNYIDAERESKLEQLPPGLSIMDFNEALEVVRESILDDADRRRIYIAAKLVGAGDDDAASIVFGEELVGQRDLTRLENETNIIETLFAASGLKCLVTNNIQPAVSISPIYVSTIVFDVNINQPFSSLLPRLDPQSWDVCNPYFEKAWTVDDRADVQPNFDVPESANRPDLGISWKKPFFEEFKIAEPIWFKTVLDIETCLNKGKKTYDMEFSLFNCKRSQILASEITGGIDVDDGESGASDVGGNNTRCKGRKRLRMERRGTGTAQNQFFVMLNIWCALALHASTEEGLQISLCCK